MNPRFIRISTAALAFSTLMACNAPRNLPQNPALVSRAPATTFGRLNQQPTAVNPNVPGRYIVKYKSGVVSASSVRAEKTTMSMEMDGRAQMKQ